MNLPEMRLRWIWRLDVRMLVIFLVAVAALAGFLKIASEVAEGDTLAIDRWVLLNLRSAGDIADPIGPAWLHQAMVDLTALGGGPVLALVTLFATGYLLAKNKASLAVFVAVAITAGATLNAALKYGFVRARPDVVPHLVDVSSASFPSGHAMNSAMVYLTLGALLMSAEPSWRVRIFLMSAVILLTLIVGFTRMYLGVHWPTDVLAGWSVGAVWAIACSILAGFLQKKQVVDGAEIKQNEVPRA